MTDQLENGSASGRRMPRGISARIFAAALVLAALVVIGLGGLVWALIDERASESAAVRTEGVVRAARDLEASAIDLETGSRGFAITNNPKFLDPWSAADRAIPAEIGTLRARAGSAGSRARIDEVAGLIQDYRREWSTPLVELTRGDPASARAMISRGGGKRRMDEIRAGFVQLLSAERAVVDARDRRSESASDLALALGLACAIGSALLILGFAAYLRRIVVRPIRRVAAVAARFTDGDRSARAATGGASELDLLARSFNEMADTVQAESAERAQARADLRERSEQFRSLAESSPDMISRIDADMRFVFVNGTLTRATGLSAEYLIGRSVPELYETPAPDGWIATLKRVLETGKRGSIVYPLATPGGTLWFESRLEPEPDSDGVVAHVLVLTRNVTAARLAEDRLRANEREQDALRTVATAVAAEGSAPELFALVAEEAGRLLNMEMAGVSRFVAVGPALVQGAWSAPGAVGDGAVDESWGDAVTLTGEATIFGAPSGPGEGGGVIGVAAPIRVGQRLWGAVAAATTRPGAIDPAAPQILGRFAELVSLAISSAEAREQLLALASTDPLTGLPNQRTFTKRLGDEVVRARRHSRPLSLMMIDIDHFKQVNDTHGHDVGNQVLVEIAHRLARLARGEDTVARVGGEEFAWILPESDARGAYWVAERARAAISETPFSGVGHLTISAGVCEIDDAAYPDELFRRADAALYSAKDQGRNTTVRWSPDDPSIPTRSSPGASTSGPAPPG